MNNIARNWPAPVVLAAAAGIVAGEYSPLWLTLWLFLLLTIGSMRPRLARFCLLLALFSLGFWARLEWGKGWQVQEPLRDLDGLRMTCVGSIAGTAHRGTNSNAALFDPAHGFAGCIAGCHEVLRRQGLLQGTWCLDPAEGLSPGQAEELDRVCAAYPGLVDDDFVAAHRQRWLAD